MKKILLFLSVLAFFGNAINAQETRKQLTLKMETAIPVDLKIKQDDLNLTPKKLLETGTITKTEATTTSRAPGTAIFSADFEGTTGYNLPSGWTKNPTSSTSLNSYWGGTGDLTLGDFTMSAHGGSRFAGIVTYNTTAVNSWMMSSPMTLTAGTTYAISWWMLIYGEEDGSDNDVLEVRVSSVGNSIANMNSGTQVFYTSTDAAFSWVLKTVHFTATANGNHWIGFHCATPANKGWFVCIDDLEVVPAKNNDLAIVKGYPYTQVPVTQKLFPTTTQIKNIGGSQQTNISLAINHNGTSYTSSTVANLNPLATTDITVNTPSVSIPLGTNKLIYTLTQSQTDNDPSDNTITRTFTGTNNTFATDNGSPSVYYSATNATYGTVYNFTQATQLCQVTTYFYKDGAAGTYTVSVFPTNGTTITGAAIHTSAAITRPTTTIWSTYSLPTPLTLSAGSYFVCVTSTVASQILADSNTEGKTSYYKVGDKLYPLNVAFMLRLAVDIRQKDATITDISSPFTASNLTANETVITTIKNNGTTPITSLNLELKVDGNVIATEPFSGNIAYGATAEYTFTQKANLSSYGAHTVAVRAILAGDEEPSNDTFTVTVHNVSCNTITSFPWTEDFETESVACWQLRGGDEYEYNWGIYDIDDNLMALSFSWLPTPSPDGTPVHPNNWLITPKLALTNDIYTLSFKVGAYDLDFFTEKYSVLVSTTGTNISDFTTTLTTETLTSSNMKTVNLSLSAYAGQNIYIAFRHWDCTDKFALLIDDVKVATPLSYQTLTPTHNSTNATIDTEVSVTFNQSFTGSLAGITINGNATTAIISGNKLIINHPTFNYNTKYTVNIPAGSINGYNTSISWSFTTLAEAVAVAIETLKPNENAEDVELNAEVSVKFNQTVTGTLTGITINNGITATPSISGDKLIIGHGNFAYGTEYTVTVPIGAINGYNQIITWKFKTKTAPALDILLKTPENGATNVALNAEVSVTFNQNIAGSLAGITINNGITATPSISGDKLIIGHGNFAYGTEYTVTIPVGAIIGYNQIIEWKFKTLNEPLAVDISLKTPENGATNVALNAEVSVTFNQTVTGTLTGITINNGITATPSISGDKLIIGHGNFAYGTEYTVKIPVGAINGYNQIIEWKFKTLDEPITVLDIASKTPASGATNVPINAEVSVTFNQNITEGNLTGITIDNGINVTATVSGSKLTISHSSFVYGTTYTVIVPAGAVTGYNTDIKWSFTTLTNPNPTLAVISKTPVENATNVALGADVSVSFNQSITAIDLTGIMIDNDIAVTPKIVGNKLTIEHGNFAYSTKYTVTIPVGSINYYDQVITWSFTTTVQNSIPVVSGNEINIYQNNCEIFVTLSENSDVRLLDIYGRVLGNYNAEANSTLSIHQSAGIYLIEVRCKGNVSTHKIVVR